MKKSILFAISTLTLLSACALQPKYEWHHLEGLGENELQRDQKMCSYFAENNIPPSDFNNFPLLEGENYGGYPFYGKSEPIERQDGYFYWHREYYRQGFYTFAYVEDMAIACMNGNGWYQIEAEEELSASAEASRHLVMKLKSLAGL